MTEMKFLSKLAQAELGIGEKFAGKLWCFVPVNNDGLWHLGIAVANERGYSPISPYWCFFKEGPHAFERAQAHANALNKERGLSTGCADLIVASTMAAQNKEQAKEPEKENETA